MSERPLPAYAGHPGYVLLAQRCKGAERKAVADQLGVSAATVTQVLNGSGAYGSGAASVERVFARVLKRFANFECPYLTEAFGELRVVTHEQCRSHAHRPAPQSPGALQHWRACQQCPNRVYSAPPSPAIKRTRKPRQCTPAQPAATSTQEPRP